MAAVPEKAAAAKASTRKRKSYQAELEEIGKSIVKSGVDYDSDMTVLVNEDTVTECKTKKIKREAFSMRKLKEFGNVVYFRYTINERGNLENVKRMVLIGVYDHYYWKPFPHEIAAVTRYKNPFALDNVMNMGADTSLAMNLAKYHGDYRSWDVEWPSV